MEVEKYAMVECPDGDYVHISDYERLEGENAELRRTVNELKEDER